MKTKEEILENKFKKHGIRKGWIDESKQAVLDAMDEYADYHVRLTLPTQNEIDEQIDKYAFRVPYDGSNNFYDKVALKHYKAGIKWFLERMKGNDH